MPSKPILTAAAGVSAVALSVGAALALTPTTPPTRPPRPAPAPSPPTAAHSDGLGLQPYTELEQAVRHEAVRTWMLTVAANQTAERVRAARIRTSSPVARTTPTVGGSCAAMKPAGFPDAIILRESGGDPNARNASGAFGCAQIMPQHYRPGGACAGMDYAGCWQRLWNGGAGASNWACTRQSGCGG